jgi:hypothetical protein
VRPRQEQARTDDHCTVRWLYESSSDANTSWPTTCGVSSLWMRAAVSTMKQRAFAEELDAGHTIRLFYSGKELKDASTLSSCGLQNGAVAHALVRRRSEPAPPPGESVRLCLRMAALLEVASTGTFRRSVPERLCLPAYQPLGRRARQGRRASAPWASPS